MAWTGEEGPVVFFAAQPRAAAVSRALSRNVIPPSARDLGLGSMRELHPRCRLFDLTGQGMVAVAMDVLAQRVKDLK